MAVPLGVWRSPGARQRSLRLALERNLGLRLAVTAEGRRAQEALAPPRGMELFRQAEQRLQPGRRPVERPRLGAATVTPTPLPTRPLGEPTVTPTPEPSFRRPSGLLGTVTDVMRRVGQVAAPEVPSEAFLPANLGGLAPPVPRALGALSTVSQLQRMGLSPQEIEGVLIPAERFHELNLPPEEAKRILDLRREVGIGAAGMEFPSWPGATGLQGVGFPFGQEPMGGVLGALFPTGGPETRGPTEPLPIGELVGREAAKVPVFGPSLQRTVEVLTSPVGIGFTIAFPGLTALMEAGAITVGTGARQAGAPEEIIPFLELGAAFATPAVAPRVLKQALGPLVGAEMRAGERGFVRPPAGAPVTMSEALAQDLARAGEKLSPSIRNFVRRFVAEEAGGRARPPTPGPPAEVAPSRAAAIEEQRALKTRMQEGLATPEEEARLTALQGELQRGEFRAAPPVEGPPAPPREPPTAIGGVPPEPQFAAPPPGVSGPSARVTELLRGTPEEVAQSSAQASDELAHTLRTAKARPAGIQRGARGVRLTESSRYVKEASTNPTRWDAEIGVLSDDVQPFVRQAERFLADGTVDLRDSIAFARAPVKELPAIIRGLKAVARTVTGGRLNPKIERLADAWIGLKEAGDTRASALAATVLRMKRAAFPDDLATIYRGPKFKATDPAAREILDFRTVIEHPQWYEMMPQRQATLNLIQRIHTDDVMLSRLAGVDNRMVGEVMGSLEEMPNAGMLVNPEVGPRYAPHVVKADMRPSIRGVPVQRAGGQQFHLKPRTFKDGIAFARAHPDIDALMPWEESFFRRMLAGSKARADRAAYLDRAAEMSITRAPVGAPQRVIGPGNLQSRLFDPDDARSLRIVDDMISRRTIEGTEEALKWLNRARSGLVGFDFSFWGGIHGVFNAGQQLLSPARLADTMAQAVRFTFNRPAWEAHQLANAPLYAALKRLGMNISGNPMDIETVGRLAVNARHPIARLTRFITVDAMGRTITTFKRQSAELWIESLIRMRDSKGVHRLYSRIPGVRKMVTRIAGVEGKTNEQIARGVLKELDNAFSGKRWAKGMTNARQLVENFGLLFPGFLRSQVGLLVDAAKIGTVEGFTAQMTLLKEFALMAFISNSLSYAMTGQFAQMKDPLKWDWLGVKTPVGTVPLWPRAALVRFIGRVGVGTTQEALSALGLRELEDREGFDLILSGTKGFARGRLGQLPAATVDQLTGTDWLGRDLTSVQDRAIEFVTNFLPIISQEGIEIARESAEGRTPTRGEIAGRLTAQAAGRSLVPPRLAAAFEEKTGLDYETTPSFRRAEIIQADPELSRIAARQEADFPSPATRIRAERSAELLPHAQAVLSGADPLTAARAYNDNRRFIMAEFGGAFGEAFRELDIKPKGKDNELLDEYHNVDFRADHNRNGIPGDDEDVKVALEEQDKLKTQMSRDVQDALDNPANFFPDADVIEVETIRRRAKDAMREITDLPKWEGLTLEQGEKLDDLVTRISADVQRFKAQAVREGLDPEIVTFRTTANWLADQGSITELDAENAIAVSSGKAIRAQGRIDLALEHKDDLLRLFPDFFDSVLPVEVEREELSAEEIERFQPAGVPR